MIAFWYSAWSILPLKHAEWGTLLFGGHSTLAKGLYILCIASLSWGVYWDRDPYPDDMYIPLHMDWPELYARFSRCVHMPCVAAICLCVQYLSERPSMSGQRCVGRRSASVGVHWVLLCAKIAALSGFVRSQTNIKMPEHSGASAVLVLNGPCSFEHLNVSLCINGFYLVTVTVNLRLVPFILLLGVWRYTGGHHNNWRC